MYLIRVVIICVKEIPDLPELTTFGAYRCANNTECLEPQYGSGPDKESIANGFIDKEQYPKLLKFAKEKGVSIITEINGPGHARAAIKSMQRRGDKNTLLYDENHQNDIESVQYFTDNVVNPCMESTFNFYDKVFKYLQTTHAEYVKEGFHDIVHLGGDEVLDCM